MTDRLAEIKERLDKAQKDPQVFEIEDRTEGWFECPLCDTNCPICENGGGAPGNQWVYKNLAAGITVFGIGDDLENLEAFAKHAPDDIKWLIEELERERADFAELMKRKERSKAMLEKCLWILNTVCDGIHDYPEIESEPVRDELFLFLHNHPEWVKRYGEAP